MLSVVYGIYLLMSGLLTVWVARTISVAGRPFLVQVFHGNYALADAINQLLIVGFYLLNAGLIGITLREPVAVIELKTGIELVSCKIGRTILILGIWHFCNVVILCWLRDHKFSVGRQSGTSL